MEKSKITYWFERGKVEADTFGEISPQNPRFHKRTAYRRERIVPTKMIKTKRMEYVVGTDSVFRGRIRRCNFPKNPNRGGNPTKENIEINTEKERMGEWRERPPKSERFADPIAFFIQPLTRKSEALARE